MNNDIQYFAKEKGSSEPPKPIEIKSQDSPSAPVKGLLKCIPSTFEYSSEFQTAMTPKVVKDARAVWYGYKRIAPIKRTRKQQIEKAKLMALSSQQKKLYTFFKGMRNAIAAVTISARELSSKQKQPSVTNRKRWK